MVAANKICRTLIGPRNNGWSTTSDNKINIRGFDPTCFCCWWPSEWRWRRLSVIYDRRVVCLWNFFSSSKSMASPWILKTWNTFFSCSALFSTMDNLGNRRRSVSFPFTIDQVHHSVWSIKDSIREHLRNRLIFLLLSSFSLFLWGWLRYWRILRSM